MQTRFVVVPALPEHRECLPRRVGFPQALGKGYDLYDTFDKLRLTLNFATRAEADYAAMACVAWVRNRARGVVVCCAEPMG